MFSGSRKYFRWKQVRETQGCKSCAKYRHSQRALSRNFLSAGVLNKLVKIFHFCTMLVTWASTGQHAQRARFSSPLHHETPYDTSDAVPRRGATNLQKSYKSLLYTCTLSDSQSGISRNFLQTSANHSCPLPSRPSVTEILLRRDEFQRRR